MAMAATAPATTSPTDRSRLRRSPRTADNMVPWIGTMSGATIIAPMTVAVESLTMPAPAMTADRSMSIQNRLSRRPTSGPSKKTASRMSFRS